MLHLRLKSKIHDTLREYHWLPSYIFLSTAANTLRREGQEEPLPGEEMKAFGLVIRPVALERPDPAVHALYEKKSQHARFNCRVPLNISPFHH